MVWHGPNIRIPYGKLDAASSKKQNPTGTNRKVCGGRTYAHTHARKHARTHARTDGRTHEWADGSSDVRKFGIGHSSFGIANCQLPISQLPIANLPGNWKLGIGNHLHDLGLSLSSASAFFQTVDSVYIRSLLKAVFYARKIRCFTVLRGR